MRAPDSSRLGERCGDHVGTHRVTIAESAKGKPVAQTGDFDLQPSDLFQVASGDTKKFASVLEVSQRRQDAGHHGYAHAAAPLEDRLAHALEDFFLAGLPYFIGNGRMAKGVAQDSGIGTAVHGHSSNR